VSALLEELADVAEGEGKKKGIKKSITVEVEEPEGLGGCIKTMFPHMDRAEAEAAFRRAVTEVMNEGGDEEME
jgi:hypothetical protein